MVIDSPGLPAWQANPRGFVRQRLFNLPDQATIIAKAGFGKSYSIPAKINDYLGIRLLWGHWRPRGPDTSWETRP